MVITVKFVPSSRKRVHVLVVEDDFQSHDALARLLRHVGYEVTGVETVAEALAELSKRPRIVVLDLMLPDGVGTQVLQEIRKRALPIGVVVTTAAVDPDLVAEAKNLNPDAFFQKPIEIPQLLAWLREFDRAPVQIG